MWAFLSSFAIIQVPDFLEESGVGSLDSGMAIIKTDAFEMAQLSQSTVWIGGLQLLPNNAAGTIGFAGSMADIVLPEGFVPSSDAPLRGVVRVLTVPNSAGPLTNLPVSVAKTGSTVEDFLITLTNTKVDLNTQVFEVYVDLIEDAPAADKPCVTVNVNCAC